MMAKLSDWIADNKVAMMMFGLSGVFIIGTMWVGGCATLDDIITEPVPVAIRKATGAPAKIPLSHHGMWWAKYEAKRTVKVAYIESEVAKLAAQMEELDIEAEQWVRGHERAEQVRNTLASIIDTTLSSPELGAVAGTFPGGALALGGLMGLGGLFIRRPGDTKKQADEKNDSFNEGEERSMKMIRDVVREVLPRS